MVAERIRLIRKNNKMSQEEFGKCLGVGRDVISNIEYKRTTPKELFLNHLCKEFSINLEWLLHGTGDMSDEHIESKKNVKEAVDIIESLNPELQKYAIQQLKLIYDLQTSDTDESS